MLTLHTIELSDEDVTLAWKYLVEAEDSPYSPPMPESLEHLDASVWDLLDRLLAQTLRQCQYATLH